MFSAAFGWRQNVVSSSNESIAAASAANIATARNNSSEAADVTTSPQAIRIPKNPA
jgi:hypothetical protein